MAISLHQLLSHKTKNIFTSENNNVAKDDENDDEKNIQIYITAAAQNISAMQSE